MNFIRGSIVFRYGEVLRNIKLQHVAVKTGFLKAKWLSYRGVIYILIKWRRYIPVNSPEFVGILPIFNPFLLTIS